jgi:hypothetical protein
LYWFDCAFLQQAIRELCEAEVAMQQLELEDRVLAEVVQEGEDAFIAQQAAAATAASTVVNTAPPHDAVPQAGVTTSLRE